MENKINEYLDSFSELEDVEKKEEIYKNIYELKQLLLKINNFPISSDELKSVNEDELLNEIFKEIVIVKELSAEMIKKIYTNY